MAGFLDGRIKLWKKEQSGKKITLKVLRTINTIKLNSLFYLNPQVVVICGDKVLETTNIENGQKLKVFKDGH